MKSHDPPCVILDHVDKLTVGSLCGSANCYAGKKRHSKPVSTSVVYIGVRVRNTYLPHTCACEG